MLDVGAQQGGLFWILDALQRTTGTTLPSGTPCEFTRRVWEVAWSSGKPKWAHGYIYA
jgi:hypothetical protein